MKTKSAIEAQLDIISIISEFRRLVAVENYKNYRLNALIENVSLVDIFALYSRIETKYKTIYLPGEIGNENITIVYVLAPGISITIESEPCLKYVPKINLINYN